MEDLIEHLEVSNGDVTLCFTCPNHGKRIEECCRNLMVDNEHPETLVRKQAYYGQASDNVKFRKGATFADDESDWLVETEIDGWDAFFFENTDYPLHVKTNKPGIKLLRLTIGKEQSQHVSAEEDVIFGSVNYKNQVGRTDIQVVYEKDGREDCLAFTTEVLSYKMDYRTDMRNVIRDIEKAFAMLSFSFLKETYLTFHTSDHESTDLLWWQIFRDCFSKITNATQLIINNPKRRLQTSVRYERAERMPYMPVELENEYEEFKDTPAHLYRMEEMYLSKDTVENRFLKYALNNMADRFKQVVCNVRKVLKADNLDILNQILAMDDELDTLVGNPFFRGIGPFRGFTQDSLVMKQAAGYRDVYEQWIILQCGYDLQEGVMRLEVKDISELYEIWCFIKVKNMVQHILRDRATIQQPEGNQTEGEFIQSLIKGSKSEVTFWENDDSNVQLASVMYNATTDDEEKITDESQISVNTDIAETTSRTTEQRPDIVLRLSKKEDSIQYTYLFDAKYRIRDTTIPKAQGVEVPPVDAINQMHRYRDAIFYTKASDEKLKREVVGGYVLYPGNLSKEQFVGSYYQRSVDEVNIGAFPLKPGGHWHEMYKKDGKYNDLLLDPTSSEDVLYHQIETWLNDEHARQTLVAKAIPQKGLRYEADIEKEGILMVMMEKFDSKCINFLPSGKIAVGIKYTKDSMEIVENLSSIGYILFHHRNATGQHLYAIEGKCKVISSSDIESDRYKNINTTDLYIVVDINTSEKLDVSTLDSSKKGFTKLTRYDAQFATKKELSI